MIGAFTEYIKSIVFFLIFSSFVGIILPNGKYKNYISIVLGFILLFIVVEPLSALGKSGFEGLVSQMDKLITQNINNENIITYGEQNNELVVQNFRLQLQSRIAEQVSEYGYTLLNLEVGLDLEAGRIESIVVFLKNKNNEEKKNEEINITVEPIQIGEPVNTGDEETPEAVEMKNMLSSFYNIRPDNIYINIQKE